MPNEPAHNQGWRLQHHALIVERRLPWKTCCRDMIRQRTSNSPLCRVRRGKDVMLGRRFGCVGHSASLTAHRLTLGEDLFQPYDDRNCDLEVNTMAKVKRCQRVTSCSLLTDRPPAQTKIDGTRVQLRSKKEKESRRTIREHGHQSTSSFRQRLMRTPCQSETVRE